MSKKILLAILAALSCSAHGAPRSLNRSSAQLTIRADQPGAKIDANIYGQFMEHLGRNVYEGIWVGERLHDSQHARLSQ